MEASSPAARCQSCGGPSTDGDLCKSCREVFAPGPGSATVTKPSDDAAAMAGPQRAPAVEQKTESVEQKAPTVVKTTVAMPPPVVSTTAIQVEVSRSDTAKAVADLTAKTHLAKAANPAPVPKRPVVAAPPQRQSRTTVWLKAAALIVVAIGAAEGARRFGFQWPQQAAREGLPVQPAPAVESRTASHRGATPPDSSPVPTVVAENRASAVAPPKAVASPKPTTAAGRRRAVRQETLSEQQVAPVVAPAPVPETPAPVATRHRRWRRATPRHLPAGFSSETMLTSRRRSPHASSRNYLPIFRLARTMLSSSFVCSFRGAVIRSKSACSVGPCWAARRTRLSSRR